MQVQVILFVSVLVSYSVGLENEACSVSQDVQTYILDLHNQARRSTGSTDMRTMKWNDELATAAHKWVDSCKYMSPPTAQEDPQSLCGTAGYQVVGLNRYPLNGPPDWHRTDHKLAAGCSEQSQKSAFQDAFENWMGQKDRFSLTHNNCKLKKIGQYVRDCDNYREIVWSTTEEIGCAMASCNYLTWKYGSRNDIICLYGRYEYALTVPHKLGAACADCPTTHRICDNGLCTRDRKHVESCTNLQSDFICQILEDRWTCDVCRTRVDRIKRMKRLCDRSCNFCGHQVPVPNVVSVRRFGNIL